MSVTVLSIPHGKVVYRRKQGYDYGGDVNHFKPLQLEYKGYFNSPVQQKPTFQDFHHPHQQLHQETQDAKQNFQQQFNNLYHQLNYHDGQFKPQEPLALFVSKPEEQNFMKQQPVKPLFDNVILKRPQNEKALEWESFKLDNNEGQLKQEFQPVLQKPPKTQFNNYNFQQSTENDHNQIPLYPPANNAFYPGLRQPQQPVNLYVGFDDFKQNAIQQPAEAAKQNFNAFNLPKLQQSPLLPSQQQKQEGLPVPSVNYNPFGGHLVEPGKVQQQQLHFEPQQQIIGQDGFKNVINQISNNIDSNNQQQQGSVEFKTLFSQIPSNTGGQIQENQGIANEFKKPNEQNILKFSNEDAVEPQEVGKVQFGKGVNFNNSIDFGVGGANINESKRENGKKKRPNKRLKSARKPQYTYIIRARRHRD